MMRKSMVKWIMGAAVIGALQSLNAPAQETPAGTASAPPPQVPATKSSETGGQSSEISQGAPTTASQQKDSISPATAQVLKLTETGVSAAVIEAYIQQAPISQPLSAADLIALKEKNVPDDVTIALLKRVGSSSNRQAETPSANAPNLSNSAAAVKLRVRPAFGGMDPESYEFWWYHYAYPRALASANQRLLSSYAPFHQSPGYYGYYPPSPYPPQRYYRNFGAPY